MSKAITEDYVSFETAKLLKEKGFNEYVMRWYVIEDSGVRCRGRQAHYFQETKHNLIKLKNYGNKRDYEVTHSRSCPYLQAERKAVVRSPKRTKQDKKQLELF